MKKRNQHYVWEHYLTAWAEDGMLHCDHNGRRFKASTGNVAHQRDFYRLSKLSEADLFYVSELARKLPEPTPTLARKWISVFQIPFKFRSLYEAAQVTRPEVEAALDEIVNNLEEDLHAHFESKAVPFLAALKRFDASPIFDEKAGIDAAMFFGLQYLRTPGMMKRVNLANTRDLPELNLETIWGLLRAIYATAFAHAVYSRQGNAQVSFLLAAPERRFITGDQPIINTRAFVPGTATTEVELYYPLTPRLGLLLSFDSDRPTSRQVQLTEAETLACNQMMVAMRDQQIYAASATDLKELPSYVG